MNLLRVGKLEFEGIGDFVVKSHEWMYGIDKYIHPDSEIKINTVMIVLMILFVFKSMGVLYGFFEDKKEEKELNVSEGEGSKRRNTFQKVFKLVMVCLITVYTYMWVAFLLNYTVLGDIYTVEYELIGEVESLQEEGFSIGGKDEVIFTRMTINGKDVSVLFDFGSLKKELIGGERIKFSNGDKVRITKEVSINGIKNGEESITNVEDIIWEEKIGVNVHESDVEIIK